MPWLNLSDDYADMLAEAGASDAAFRLHVTAMILSNRLGTDGEVSGRMTRQASADLDGGGGDAAAELVSLGLWEPSESGHRIVGFLAREGPRALHQTSKADRDALQEKNRLRQAKWRESRVTKGVSRGVTNGAHTSPLHSPPRSGVGGGSRTTGSAGPQPVCADHQLQHEVGRPCPACEADRKASSAS